MLLDLGDWLRRVTAKVFAHEARSEPGGEGCGTNVAFDEMEKQRRSDVRLRSSHEQGIEPIAEVGLIKPEIFEVCPGQLPNEARCASSLRFRSGGESFLSFPVAFGLTAVPAYTMYVWSTPAGSSMVRIP